MGTLTKETGHRYAIQGPVDNPDRHAAREVALADAAKFGVIGLLNSAPAADPNAPTAIFGRDESRSAAIRSLPAATCGATTSATRWAPAGWA